MHFYKNTVSGLNNNFLAAFFNNTKRVITVDISGNSFTSTENSSKSYLDVEFYSDGEVDINSNLVSGCSSNAYIFNVHASENLVIDNNKF